jgi:hypothetical protein
LRYLIKYFTVQRRYGDFETIIDAELYAKRLVGRLGDDAHLLAIYAGDEPPKPADPPAGKPPSGPTPGTPILDRYEVAA